MSEPLAAGQEYFRTTDKVLAMALAMAGCKFAPFADYGPAINTYSPATARDRRMIGTQPISTHDFEMAVFRAFEAKRPAGIITYLVERDSIFTDCLKSWDAIPAEIETAKTQNRPPIFPEVKAEDVMRVMFLSRLQQRSFDPMPWMQLPVLSLGDSKTVETPMFTGPMEPGVVPPMKTTTTGDDCMVWNWKSGDAWRERNGLPPLDPKIREYINSKTP